MYLQIRIWRFTGGCWKTDNKPLFPCFKKKGSLGKLFLMGTNSDVFSYCKITYNIESMREYEKCIRTSLETLTRKNRCFKIEAIQIPIVYNKYGDYDPNGLLYVLKEDSQRIQEEANAQISPDTAAAL